MVIILCKAQCCKLTFYHLNSTPPHAGLHGSESETWTCFIAVTKHANLFFFKKLANKGQLAASLFSC